MAICESNVGELLTAREIKHIDDVLERLSKKYRSLGQDIQVVKQNVIELLHVHNIEIYHKNDKANNDAEKLKSAFDSLLLDVVSTKVC